MLTVVSVMLIHAAAAPGQLTTERTRVQFELTSKTCPRLPAGTRLKGSGRQKAVTNTITDPNGVKTVANFTRARGKVTNQRGVRYTFDYRNSFSVSNTAATPAQYSGTMVDSFEMVRRGRTRLSNGFIAVFTTDLGASNTFQPLYAFGDPIDFAKGTPHCDPL
jgi:hypothetical protein